MAPPRPVTLRDFLELGCDSSSDGLRAYPRRLSRDDAVAPHPLPQAAPARLAAVAEAEADDALRRSPSSSHSQRSPSPSPFALPGPGALARISSLSRSFSRRIKEGLWRRRLDDGEEEEEYFDDRDSCGFPSPLVSSCSASDSDDADDVTLTVVQLEKPTASAPASECGEKASSSSTSAADHDDHCTDAADGNTMQPTVAEEGESAVGRKLGTMEDKQQLSPVSVLDFPFDDDDGEEEEGSDAGTCSPAFQRRPPPDHLPIIRTKKQQLAVHKARRTYDDPVDLDARFVTAASESESGESVGASTRLAATSSSSTTDSSGSGTATTAPRHGDDDEEEHQSVDQPPSQDKEPDDDKYRLLTRLLQEASFAACLLADDEVARALVLDFFAEGAGSLRSAAGGAVVGAVSGRRVAAEEEALVRAAADWLRGAGPRWGVADVVHSGTAALADMERGRRWMCVAGAEDRDVGVEVEGVVVDALVDELVTELVGPWWWWHGDGRRCVEVELPASSRYNLGDVLITGCDDRSMLCER